MDTSDAYANAKYIPNAETFPPQWEDEAAEFRRVLISENRAEIGVSYGDHPRARFDLFLPIGAPKGLLVFVHGGYWRAFDRTTWSHFARGALKQGWAVSMPGYPLAPEVGILDITRYVKQAIEKSATFVDGPIILSGHSAGGHLVARMLCEDGLKGDVAARLRRVMPISPLSDLRPLVNADLNEDLRLTSTEAEAESPVLLLKSLDVPVTVWVGADERPAFLDQASWLAESWPDTSCVIEDGRHHFDVIDGLHEPDSALLKALLA